MLKLADWYYENRSRFEITEKAFTDLFTGKQVEVSTDDRMSALVGQIKSEAYRAAASIESATGDEIVEIMQEFETIVRMSPRFAASEATINALAEYDNGNRTKWDVVSLLLP